MFGLLVLLFQVLLYVFKKYGLFFVKSWWQWQCLEGLLLRLGVALWLNWAVFVFYCLLLAFLVFVLVMIILLIVLGWLWWKDFYFGFLLWLEGDLCFGDYLSYEGWAYKILQLCGRSVQLAGEDGGLLVLFYYLIQKFVIYWLVEKIVFFLFFFEVMLEGFNVQQCLE